MKKIFLSILLLAIVSTIPAFGQRKEKRAIPKVSFCGATKDYDVVKYADLGKCEELTQPYGELQIKSFKIRALIPPKDGNGEGMYVDKINVGSKLTKESIKFIKTFEAKKVKVLLFEEVIIIAPNGKNRKMEGLKINLE